MNCETELDWMLIALDILGVGVLILLIVIWERRDEIKALKEQLINNWRKKDE
jgi:hypothetical protein